MQRAQQISLEVARRNRRPEDRHWITWQLEPKWLRSVVVVAAAVAFAVAVAVLTAGQRQCTR